jgi:hypothetical protein
MILTNTKRGPIQVIAAEDLSGLEGRLAKLTNASGVLKAALPTAIGDYALFLIVEGAAAGGNATLAPLEPGAQVRVRLNGTCDPAAVLVLADPGTAADKGKARTLPTAAGTYRGLLIAEEAGVDEQLVLARPAMLGNLTVT